MTSPTWFQRLSRHVVPVFFVIAVLVAATLALPWFKLDRPEFSHRYATAPSVTDGVQVGQVAEPIPPTNVLQNVTINSIDALAQTLPPDAVGVTSTGIRVLQPVLIGVGAHVSLGQGSDLVMSAGSYLEVGSGGSLEITGSHVRATGPLADRAFLADIGGQLRVSHSTLSGLGRNASMAWGVSFRNPTPGSGVFDSDISGGNVGVHVAESRGFSVTGNTFSFQSADAVWAQGFNVDLNVSNNKINGPGMDGVAVTGRSTSTQIRDNHVAGARRDGVLLFASTQRPVVISNRISNAFDGLVLNGVVGATVTNNAFTANARFALRLSGATSQCHIARNDFTNNVVAVYAAGGPHYVSLTGNSFSGNDENVRIRTTANNVVVSPVPPRSELRSA